MFEYFIAKRYLRSKHKLNFITIISLLSTTGIAIGVAALIVVLSVFNGFGSLVTSILVSFDPHIRISVVDEKGFASLNSIETTLNGNKNINQYFPFVEGKAILLNRQTYEIINLKGIKNIREEDAGWGIASKIISGKMNLPGNSNNIVLGLPLALRLSARVGDTITVTSAYNIEKTIASFSLPQTRRFIVAVFLNQTTAITMFRMHSQILPMLKDFSG
jgi:lipoprotein-releasing system permease protein